VTGTDLKWTASRNDLEREINAEKARTDLRGNSNPHAAGDDLQSEERRLAERLNKLRLDMYTMGGDGSCQVRKSFDRLWTQRSRFRLQPRTHAARTAGRAACPFNIRDATYQLKGHQPPDTAECASQQGPVCQDHAARSRTAMLGGQLAHLATS